MLFAEGSAPSLRTVRAQIKRQELPGTIIAGLYYVDLDELERKTNLRAGLAARETAILQSCPELADLM